MGSFSLWHWIIVLIIVVLVFGTKKLRNVGKDLGGAVHDFKQGLNEGRRCCPDSVRPRTSAASRAHGRAFGR